MKKRIIMLFLLLSFASFAEWKETDKATKDGLTSIKLKDTDDKSTGLLVQSDSIDGNVSVVYWANLVIKELKDVESIDGFSVGYNESDKKYVAMKSTTGGIIYLENDKKERLLNSLKSFNKSKYNM